jgi:molecular chaperone IbpA
MANLDFTPLYRTTIGFDRLPLLMQTAMRTSDSDLGYPPYNIEKLGDDAYRIVVALAGFTKDDLEVVSESGRLVVRGKMSERADDTEYLHRGIASRSFERRFDLADYVEVEGATFENGLLTIGLRRELPEKFKPRTIKLGRSPSVLPTVKRPSQAAA